MGIFTVQYSPMYLRIILYVVHNGNVGFLSQNQKDGITDSEFREHICTERRLFH